MNDSFLNTNPGNDGGEKVSNHFRVQIQIRELDISADKMSKDDMEKEHKRGDRDTKRVRGKREARKRQNERTHENKFELIYSALKSMKK